VDESLGAKLSHWLERLGFVKAGQHRSKSVSLLRQGDINLILNAEPYSFGHSFRGPRPVAVRHRRAGQGQRQALARAVAYKGQPYRGLVGPNELELAAVRAPDGSLIYLVDEAADVYGTDFNLQPNAPWRPQAHRPHGHGAAGRQPRQLGAVLQEPAGFRGRRRSGAARPVRPGEEPRVAQPLTARFACR
jgi:4-hydroxyphenylpyruvate dioxygenase-like putative hemolysin